MCVYFLETLTTSLKVSNNFNFSQVIDLVLGKLCFGLSF